MDGVVKFGDTEEATAGSEVASAAAAQRTTQTFRKRIL